MSADLIEALRHAQHAGSVAFELRDPEDAIRPARRRVRRHKAVVGGATAVGAVAVVGAAAWGVGEISLGGMQSADAPMGGGPGGVADATSAAPDEPSVGSEAERPLALWDVVASAEPRLRGEQSDGRAALLACDREDDPLMTHDYEVPGTSYTIADCASLWSDAGLHLTVSPETTVGMDIGEGTVTARYTIVNDGTVPVPYRVAIYGLLETDADELADESGFVDGLVFSEKSAWANDSTRTAVMNSKLGDAILLPGESFTGTLTWRGEAADGTALGRILGGEADFTVTFGVRLMSGDQGPLVDYVDPPVFLEVSDGLTYGLEREPS